MPIKGITQPDIIEIDPTLRLRKMAGDWAFANAWYQDEEILRLDGASKPYSPEEINGMYSYLINKGEAWFIEVRESAEDAFTPIGDVTFWQEDMPILIGDKSWWHRGVGRRVVAALIARGRELGYTSLGVSDIYDFNIASQRLFEGAGFVKCKKTEKGHSYVLEL